MTSTFMTIPSGIFVDFKSLLPGSKVDVETKSRHYHIECLGGGEMRISGHPQYCPEPTSAHLQGSLDKEGVLELGQIGRGKRLMFYLNGTRPVTTSSVISVHVRRPDEIEPSSSRSIH